MRIKLKTIKAFIKKRKKLLCILAIACVVLAVGSGILTLWADKSKCEDIRSIALVYRRNNTWGGTDDVIYVQCEDGTVYYKDMEKYNEEHDNEDNTLLDDVLMVLQDDENISHKSEGYPNDIKSALYSIDYDFLSLKYENGGLDAPIQCYYALVQREKEYKLVKLREEGKWHSDPKLKSIRFFIKLDKIYYYMYDNLPQ